jgi:hypothetical protein
MTVSLPRAFECVACGGWFAQPGVAVEALDPSHSGLIDFRNGEVCEFCARTWQPASAFTAATEALCDGLGGEILQQESANGFERLLSVRSAVTDSRYACAECGALFAPRRTDARFCSPKCRARHFRRKASVTSETMEES